MLLAAAEALPQAATGALEVTLPADAPATIRLEAPGVLREALSDPRGRAFFPHLRPGTYRLSVVAPPNAADLGPMLVAVETGRTSSVALAPCPECPPVPTNRRVGSMDRGTTLDAGALAEAPRPADVWSLLGDVPAVVVDRVNVGGSETAQQSLLVAKGDGGAGATFSLDGVDVTDPAALGFSALFADVDALDSVTARTSAIDVRVRTPGVQVSLLLREPRDRFAGRAHVRATGDALQSDNATAELEARPLLRSRTSRVLELGVEGGGAVKDERLWLWAGASLDALRQDTFTEHEEDLRTTSFAGKGRLRLGRGTLSLLALRAEKVHEDRDPTFSAAPAARWRQSGPAHLVALEDQRSWSGLSVLSRVSYLDAGFRLDPQGGASPNAFEDFRGIAQGSYVTLATDRPRVQAGVELAGRRRLLGRDNDLLLGASYRRSRVTTRQSWPGNGVLGFERQSVFFRTFRLTGFALPTRDQDGRSLQHHLDVYAQDTLRVGRLAAVVGARMDLLSGRNLPSSVEPNPVFPSLLPAVDYAGSPARIRWLDVLPRAGLAWDVTGEGTVVARATYAAYGSALGAGDVTFDNPIGREPATVSYYWLDRDGDHSVQTDEIDQRRGRQGSSGIDPGDPGSAISPHVVDPDLRSPRTYELTASLETSLGRSLEVGLHGTFRRLVRPLWRPLRNLALADYVVRGSARGELFGEPYDVAYFAPASASRVVPGNGRVLTNREGYRQEAFVLEAVAAGSAGARLRWRAWGALTDWRERFAEGALAIQDPTPLDVEPLQDRGVVAARPGGLGRGDVFVNARWSLGAWLRAELPARLSLSALLHARDGFPVPYLEVADTGDPTGGAKNVLVAPHLDSYRLPALVLLDTRLERAFSAGRGTLTAAIDVFNVLNRATTLQVARDVDLPAFGRPREVLRPRIVRLEIAYRF